MLTSLIEAAQNLDGLTREERSAIMCALAEGVVELCKDAALENPVYEQSDRSISTYIKVGGEVPQPRPSGGFYYAKPGRTIIRISDHRHPLDSRCGPITPDDNSTDVYLDGRNAQAVEAEILAKLGQVNISINTNPKKLKEPQYV